ncbi:MAG: twin-arginine translocase TatA/TatE family subunit [Epsilonproteobacteria bacterium]|nr:twin-arginine translocase TatA/TatE family subunit [Campylobacterota bacterium]NPA56812.1 twin-arginine translocase TatA/TatE family subunit [Campylobacterota bacterium]
MGMPSMPELLVILAIVVLLFGAKKIPELAKGIGSGIKNFKKAMREDDDEVAQTTPPKEVERKEQQAQATPPQQQPSQEPKA